MDAHLCVRNCVVRPVSDGGPKVEERTAIDFGIIDARMSLYKLSGVP